MTAETLWNFVGYVTKDSPPGGKPIGTPVYSTNPMMKGMCVLRVRQLKLRNVTFIPVNDKNEPCK